jgi:hypothetical protein
MRYMIVVKATKDSEAGVLVDGNSDTMDRFREMGMSGAEKLP